MELLTTSLWTWFCSPFFSHWTAHHIFSIWREISNNPYHDPLKRTNTRTLNGWKSLPLRVLCNSAYFSLCHPTLRSPCSQSRDKPWANSAGQVEHIHRVQHLLTGAWHTRYKHFTALQVRHNKVRWFYIDFPPTQEVLLPEDEKDLPYKIILTNSWDLPQGHRDHLRKPGHFTKASNYSMRHRQVINSYSTTVLWPQVEWWLIIHWVPE